MRKYISYFEHYFTLFSVTFLIGNPLEVLILGNTSQQFSDASNSIETLLKMCIFGITLCFVCSNWKKVLYRLIIKNKLVWFVLILTALTFASYFWSLFPDITLRRSILASGATLFGIYFGTRYTLDQQIKFLAWGFGAVMLMSLFFGIALPRYGVMSTIHAGAWCGIFSHKNGLGYYSALSSILFLIRSIEGTDKNWKNWLMFTLSLILLILARSSTALLAFLTISASLGLYRALRLRYDKMIPVLIFIFLFVASIAILIVGERETFASMVGKDLTLTGRTDLWPLTWDAIQESPWLGYGFEGFWLPQNAQAFRIWAVTGWRPTHPHNGFLKLLIEIGWLGGVVFISAFFLAFIKSLILVRSTKSAYYYWPIAFLSFFLLTSITESSLMDGGFSWILFTGVCLL